MDGTEFKGDGYTIQINYSDEAKQKELIKIIPTGKEIIFSSDDIVKIIIENFRNKELAYALSTTDTSFIPSVEVAVPIHFNASKDIKQGELVQFFAPMIMPMGIALAMEAHKLCIDKGLDVLKIPRTEFEEAKTTLVDSAKKFVEEYFKPQIEQLRKAADTGKAVS